MKCPNHFRTEVAGYCCVCGSFFCENCLTRHEGQLYCKKHYKPIAQKLGRERHYEETKKRHGRHSLIIRYTDGRIEQGICLTLNPKDSGLTLQCVDKNGATLEKAIKVRFSELKAVFNVKSFDGKFDASERYPEYAPGGRKVFVKFKDGEVVEGTTLNAYNPDDPRFYVIPDDPDSNNINILVEASAVEAVYTPDEYAALSEKKVEAESEAAETQELVDETAELGQDESMGDFYFETRSYSSALEQYRLALEQHPGSPRLKRKVVVSAINVGIQHIKKREYPAALACMEAALEHDPNNPHASKRAKQLRRIIEKTERRMRAYAKQSEPRKTAETGDDK